MELLEPKDVPVTTQKGDVRTYVLSKFPATDGREIAAKYPLSNMPKIGDYGVSEETMLKLMAFVAVRQDSGQLLRLTTKALVNNHVPDWETLVRIEGGMLEYNTSFFSNGKASTFLAGIGQAARSWITSTLTDLLEQSSRQAKPRSTNSARSTRSKTRS